MSAPYGPTNHGTGSLLNPVALKLRWQEGPHQDCYKFIFKSVVEELIQLGPLIKRFRLEEVDESAGGSDGVAPTKPFSSSENFKNSTRASLLLAKKMEPLPPAFIQNPFIDGQKRSVCASAFGLLKVMAGVWNVKWDSKVMFIYQNTSDGSNPVFPEAEVRLLSITALKVGLPALMETLRGQSSNDPRPNKNLHPDRLLQLLSKFKYKDAIVEIARVGFKPVLLDGKESWKGVRPIPCNADSANADYAVRQIRRKTIKDFQAGRNVFLLEKVAVWFVQYQSSPFSLIKKRGFELEEKGQLIHNLSFPAGKSFNDQVDQDSNFSAQWGVVPELARQIVDIKQKFPNGPHKRNGGGHRRCLLQYSKSRRIVRLVWRTNS